ncbi:hypothetical protein C5167_002064 [Papaver somniferum]|uniref:Uncharacterized protein n=1 Tax=Papaver somniferum TaxID=3469 RepID=A0A4Y7KY89_PAPSO|nr:hypothetical protein C5167_002064 [Papaver somniferum]
MVLNYCKYSWTYGVWKWPSSASTSFTSSINTYAGSTKSYTEIENAFNNFRDMRILGEGGFFFFIQLVQRARSQLFSVARSRKTLSTIISRQQLILCVENAAVSISVTSFSHSSVTNILFSLNSDLENRFTPRLVIPEVRSGGERLLKDTNWSWKFFHSEICLLKSSTLGRSNSWLWMRSAKGIKCVVSCWDKRRKERNCPGGFLHLRFPR